MTMMLMTTNDVDYDVDHYNDYFDNVYFDEDEDDDDDDETHSPYTNSIAQLSRTNVSHVTAQVKPSAAATDSFPLKTYFQFKSTKQKRNAHSLKMTLPLPGAQKIKQSMNAIKRTFSLQ